jgi:hypothetical protein
MDLDQLNREKTNATDRVSMLEKQINLLKTSAANAQ